VLYLKGRHKKKKEKYEQALNYFEKAIDFYCSLGDDASIAMVLHHIGIVQYYIGEYDASIQAYQESGDYWADVGNWEKLSNTHFNLGLTYREFGSQELAIQHMEKAISLCENHACDTVWLVKYKLAIWNMTHEEEPKDSILFSALEEELLKGNSNRLGELYLLLGIRHMQSRNNLEAFQAYLKSAEIYHQQRHWVKLGMNLHYIGLLFREMEQDEQAYQYFLKALNLRTDIGDERGMLTSSIFLGEGLVKQGKFLEALAYYDDAVCLAEKHGNGSQMALTYLGIGEAEFKMEHFDLAEDYFGLAVEEALASNHMYYEYNAYFCQGLLYIEQGRYNRGESLLRKVLNWSSKKNFNGLARETARELSSLMAKKKRWKEASQLREKEKSLTLKISNQPMSQKLLQKEFLSRLKHLEDKEAEKRGHAEALHHAEMKKKVAQQTYLLSALALSILIASLLNKNIQLKKRSNRKLREMNLLVSKKNEEIIKLNEDLEGKIQERTRVLSHRNEQLRQYAFMNSHIVRGPLSNILGIFNMRREGILDNPEVAVQFLDMAAESANKMDRIIEDINSKLYEEISEIEPTTGR